MNVPKQLRQIVERSVLALAVLIAVLIWQDCPATWWVWWVILLAWVLWPIVDERMASGVGPLMLYALIWFFGTAVISQVYPIAWRIGFSLLLLWLLRLIWFRLTRGELDWEWLRKVIAECLDCWRLPSFPLAAYIILVELTWLFDWFYIRPHGVQVNVNDFTWLPRGYDTTVAIKELSARLIIEAVDILQLAAAIAAWCIMLAAFVRECSWTRVRPLLSFAVIATAVYLVLQWGFVSDPWQTMLVMKPFTQKVALVTERPDFAAYLRHWASHLSLAALPFASLVSGLIMSEPADDIKGIKRQLKTITRILYVTAFAMILHVVDLGVYRLRAAALLDENNAAFVRQLATFIAINAGVRGMLSLLPFTWPSVEVLTKKARRLRRQSGSDANQSDEKWIESSTQYFLRIATVLSPLIAGIPLLQLLFQILH